MPRRKLIYRENLDIDSEESTRLSYDVIFQEPQMKQEIAEQEEQQEKEELEKALQQQREEFENKLAVEKEQAAQQAYQKGFSAGKEEAKELISHSLGTFEEALQNVETKMESLAEDLNPGITTMVFELAEKILQIPIESSELRETMQQEVSEVFQTLDDELSVKVYLSPQDISAIKELAGHFDLKKISVHKDESLNPGEYAIETSEKTIERKFKKLLDDIRQNTELEQWKLTQ